MLAPTPTLDDVHLSPCNYCGRTFRPDVLSRHMPICAKSQNKKRKIFDSGKMRAQGTDIPVSKTLRPGEVPKETQKDRLAAAKTANWRTHHEQFIKSLRAARQYATAKETGAPLPPPPPPEINPDLILCPYCSRRFSDKAAERHIPFCKEKSSRMPGGRGGGSPMKGAPRLAQPSTMVRPSGPASGTMGSRKPILSGGSNSSRGGGTMGFTNGGASGVGGRGDTSDSNNSYGSRPLNNRQTEMARINQQRKPTPTGGIPAPSTIPRGGGGSRMPVARQMGLRPTATTGGAGSGGSSAFCHECGSKFPSTTAKFCAECGTKRA